MKYLCHHTKNRNNNDDINDISDLPFDEMCIFLEQNKYMTPCLENRRSICNLESSEINTEQIS